MFNCLTLKAVCLALGQGKKHAEKEIEKHRVPHGVDSARRDIAASLQVGRTMAPDEVTAKATSKPKGQMPKAG